MKKQVELETGKEQIQVEVIVKNGKFKLKTYNNVIVEVFVKNRKGGHNLKGCDIVHPSKRM